MRTKLLALQQPVAGDLRKIVGSIQIIADIERMDALAVHVAKIARRRHPEPAVPEEVSSFFDQMGQVACQLATIAREVHRTRDPQKAAGTANVMTPWTPCTGNYSPCFWMVVSGLMVSKPQSMPHCLAASMSASPTTPSR